MMLISWGVHDHDHDRAVTVLLTSENCLKDFNSIITPLLTRDLAPTAHHLQQYISHPVVFFNFIISLTVVPRLLSRYLLPPIFSFLFSG